MNCKLIKISKYCLVFLLLFLSTKSICQQQIDSFSLSSYVTIPSPEKVATDSLTWQQQKLITRKYQHKRIKQISIQHLTNKAIIFFKDGEVMEMSRKRAMKEHLVRLSSDTSEAVVSNDMVALNSGLTFYTGIIYHVRIEDDNPDDFFIDDSSENNNKPFADVGDYCIKSSMPGNYKLTVNNKKTGKIIYQYNYIIKPLPINEPTNIPVATIGDIDSSRVPLWLFKQQNEIKISNGYTFQSAVVSTTDQEQHVQQTLLTGSDLSPIRWLIDSCQYGSQVSFDNIQVTDSLGKQYLLKGRFYTLTDSNMAIPYINQSLAELNNFMKHNFVRGAIYFSGSGFLGVVPVYLNWSNPITYQNCYALCRPGSIITLDKVVYRKEDGTLSEPISRCIRLY